MRTPEFCELVAEAIAQHGLLRTGQTVLVGLSGGADSVALLLVLMELGYTVEAAHCNFHLRGADSDADARFVADLCARRHVVLHGADFDTSGYAAAQHVSLEMAARHLRYDFFERLCRQRAIASTAVAHHREDNVETILLNLVRGTGLKGLCGMAWQRDGIIRPLLGTTRAEILSYLQAKGQTFVTDQTNLQPIAKRNVLRLEVLPLLRELNPAFDEAVLRMARHSREALLVCNRSVQTLLSQSLVVSEAGQLLRSEVVKAFAAPRLLLHAWLAPHGFNSAQLTEILAAIDQAEQKQFIGTEGEWVLCSRRGVLLTRPAKTDSAPRALQVPGRTELSPPCALRAELMEREELSTMKRSPRHAYLDADRLKAPLVARHAERGDRFRPFGMKGSKLVSDFLTDQKIPAYLRSQQWVVLSGGEIVWVVGLRLAAPFALGADTRRIVHLWVEE